MGDAKLICIVTCPNPLIFLSAGEASGDHYGAAIIAELRRRIPAASFTGLGGTAMESAGQQRIVRAEDVAHMGLTEVLRHALYIHSQYRALVRAIKRSPPALAILIDFPDVNFRLAAHCKRLGVPVLWFVSPQLWAWKRRRLRWVQKRVDRMLVIFPFEAPFYRNRSVNAEFVGHPLATEPLPTISREAYAEGAGSLHQEQWNFAVGVKQSMPLPDWAFDKGTLGIRYPLDSAKEWIALLPGSRESEIFANLPCMVEAAMLLGDMYEYIIPVAPTVSVDTLTAMQEITGDRLIGPNPPRITFVRDARAALHHARAAIVASGTATVQALTIGNPFVVVYRVSSLTYKILKRLIRYPAEIPAQPDADGNLPIAMPNLIAGRRIVPELINARFTAANLAAALRPLLDDTPARAQMIADLAETRAKLLPTPGLDPIHKVCDAAEALLQSAAAQ
ncbi:MAG: lipid-A-disaccharide synthase [Acidobacteriota bacterium]|nr:lipid-A-disaccharide synthase [Acidobacteriota bacterium]